MIYAPLHNHSEFSALDGLSTCREIAERCVELGCPCCGLTDHGTVAGHLEFSRELTKHGIKPIFGAELYHGVRPKGFKNWTRNERDQAHFVVGARTNEGLRNLWRLIDAASNNFRYVGRTCWADLERFSDGLFATSACIQGLVSQGIRNSDLTALDKYIEIFRDNFYLELHTYPGLEQEDINQALVQIGTERGIPFVYANDAHFASPSQYPIHDGYVAMQTGQSIDTPINDRKMWHPMALYMQEEWEIRNALHYLPESIIDEALANTATIGDGCDVTLPEVSRHLPTFVPSECEFVDDKEVSAGKLFIDLVEKGIHARYGDSPREEVWDRATREMNVFLDADLHHYFLQAWDFCEFCDREGIIRGPGRGSAAGSLVAYTLGITDVDPLHYNLIFERFFNPGRAKGFPDIDNDFPKGDRKKVKDYLARRWGANNVRSIGTVTRMKPKAALDKTYAAMGVTYAEKETIKSIVAQVPDLEILGSESIGWANDGGGKTIYVLDHVGKDIEREINRLTHDRQAILRRWLDFVGVICGRASGYGVHASGVVVSDVALDEQLPCFWSANQECQATMFPMTEVELRQFVKQDILGLRTLDTLQDWHRQMKDKYGINVKWSGLEMKEHPLEMWEMLDKGLATGVFQIEDRPFVRQLTMDFKPRSVEDLSIIVALNRPGPIRSGAPDSFVRRRRGDEPVEYDHPFLEDILHETYGWFLYQEQVIAFFSKLGYSLEDADAVRKILGKKKPEEMRALYAGEGEWEGKSYRQMAKKCGLTHPEKELDAADVIWRKLEDFAKYSFNKSHSVAYATIAFRTLYAKYYATPEFIMACIRTNNEDRGLYVAEGRRMGVQVLPPDIRNSGVDVDVRNGDIYFGLANVKGVGKGTARYVERLVKEYDIYTRADIEIALSDKTAEWEQKRDAHKEKGTGAPFKVKSPRQECRSNVIDALEDAGAFDNYEERVATLSDIQKAEKELLGIILTDNSEEAFRNNDEVLADCDDYESFHNSTSEVVATLPGTIVSVRETKTRATQKEMGIVKIEWGIDTVEFAVFPQQWKAYKFMWRERTPGIFTLKKSAKGINFEDGIKLS
jgi:DNA polymerase-3 subunit alpha